MKKILKIILIIVLICSLVLYVFYRVKEYNRIYNPTKGMTSQKTIDFYFDIKIPDESLIKEEYVNNGRVAYKVDVTFLNDSDIDLFTKEYEEFSYERYNLEEGGNPFDDVADVDWWNLNKDIVKKSFEKLDFPKRDIDVITARYLLFFAEEKDNLYMYMLYLD